MSDNPLETTPRMQAVIDDRARALWEDDGSPEGRLDEYKERAEELVQMERAGPVGQLPNPMNEDNPMPGVIVEEASIQENLGEIPGRMTDRGDWRQTPMTREELRHEDERQPDHGDTP